MSFQEKFSEREEEIAPEILNLKPCEQQTKGNKICVTDPWKAWEKCSIHNVTYNEGQEPNTSKPSTKDKN